MTLVSLWSLLFKSTAFQNYARQNWSAYASMVASGDASSIQSLFISQPKLVKESWSVGNPFKLGKYDVIVPAPTSPLQVLSWYGLERFIQPNDNFEFKNNEGWTAIFFASVAGKATVIDTLLQSGAKPNAVDVDGRTALSYAALSGKSESVQTLVAKGADMDLVDKNGRSALLYAVQHGHSVSVQTLVGKGANINLVDKDGQSALSYAAQHGHSVSVQTLVGKGANMDLVDKDG
jgi:ankyrin repeat protein